MSKRKSYEVGFKLKVVDYAEEHGNRCAERQFGGLVCPQTMVRPICESTAKYLFIKPKLTVRPIREYIRYV